ncbi:unnamed protein product [Pseudo-nitzschia multistriata]|uniref:DUF819 domain-containing protein n=1 Tax=Pseudo-nitzschia multistriata TaxID=183589 RepID=A0A448ZE19_9STRA|nr:unnamed protein product [Pseudo-nitzschia multistriata]
MTTKRARSEPVSAVSTSFVRNISSTILLMLHLTSSMVSVEPFSISSLKRHHFHRGPTNISHLLQTTRLDTKQNTNRYPNLSVQTIVSAKPTGVWSSPPPSWNCKASGRTPTALGSGSLVAAGDQWGNLSALAAVSVASQRLGRSTRVGRLLGAPVTAMALTFFLASVGVLAQGGTPTSRSLQTMAIRFATPWILLGAEFGTSGGDELVEASSSSSSTSVAPLVVGFGLASLATLAGGCIGWNLAGGALVSCALGGHDGLAIASALLAKNIGGGINYVAVCAALEASPEAIAVGLCIDNIGALVYFPISNLLASRYPDVTDSNASQTNSEARNDSGQNKDSGVASAAVEPMTVSSISMAFFAATTLLWMGDYVASSLLKSPSSQIPVVTLLAVVLAGIVAPRLPTRETDGSISSSTAGGPMSEPKFPLFPSSASKRALRSTCDTLGTFCLYLFFTTAGAPGIKVAKSMTSALVPLSLFSILLYAVHGGILSALYQLGHEQSRFRRKRQQRREGQLRPTRGWLSTVLSPQRLLVASSSAIGGPPTSVALARSVSWDSLVVPALLVGNIGYAVSTFIGIAFYYCLKSTVL